MTYRVGYTSTKTKVGGTEVEELFNTLVDVQGEILDSGVLVFRNKDGHIVQAYRNWNFFVRVEP